MNRVLGISHILFLEMKRKISGKKFMAELDVTDNCNLRCKHCYHFHGKNNFMKNEVPIKIWKKRFEDLHKSGIRFLLLVGGEPALRKNVLILADKMFPFVYVITNGTIKLPEEFNHRLYVSIDGTEKTNDSIRGKGTFSKIIENYRGDKRVIINMTINKDNYKELEKVVEISNDNGFSGVVCNICAQGTDTDISLSVKRKEREDIIKELKRVKKLYPNNFLLSETMIKWYDDANHVGWCYWGDEALHFDVNWSKRRCFGDNADCSNCGCLAGAFQSYFKMMLRPREMLKIGFV